jgi:hypothetical protein
MKYIIRKFVDASTVQEAIRMDRKTPVHDCYLKEGEEMHEQSSTSAIGFHAEPESDTPCELRRRR